VGPEVSSTSTAGTRTRPSASRRVLRQWNAATGEDRPVATFDADFVAGLKRLFLTAGGSGRAEPLGHRHLMMIENFR